MGLTDGVLLASGFGLICGLKSALGRSGSVSRESLLPYKNSVWGSDDVSS
jgi:hypothetical protein